MRRNSPASRNIRAIGEFERATLAKRSLSARVGDFVATHAGRMWFILAHVVWFAGWGVLNFRANGSFSFYPFPFALLTMIVSLESIFLSLFILMSQNRSSRLAEERNHLDLQINLLAEDENTKLLLMLQALCDHHKLPIGQDPEIALMARRTHLQEVIDELKTHLPGGE